MTTSIANHALTYARQVPTANCDERPAGEISLIVVHGISLPAGEFGGDYIEQLFCNCLDSSCHPDFGDLAGLKVSSHLLIRRTAEIVQFVAFDQRAWHAGQSRYLDRSNCNDFAIGIELEGTDDMPYEDAQYGALAIICADIMQSYDIPAEAIVGHSQIAPHRKTDPGPAFDWQRFRRELMKVTIA